MLKVLKCEFLSLEIKKEKREQEIERHVISCREFIAFA